MTLICFQYFVTKICRVCQIFWPVQAFPDTNLNRLGGVYKPFLCCMIERSSVVVWLSEIFMDGVIMCIEVDQSNRSVSFCAGTQLRKRYAVITAHSNRNYLFFKERKHSFCDQIKRFLNISRNGSDIAVINTGTYVKDADVQRCAVRLCSQTGNIPDRSRTKAGSDSVRSASVKRQSDNSEINIVCSFHVFHTHESFDTGKTWRF